MEAQRKALSFKGQNIYIGIDVHLKSWSVTLMSEATQLKRFSQSPDPDALYAHLVRNYPEAEYHSVYEAGFCGFWIHYRLVGLGIHNIVVNPADVPTTTSEKLRKTDAVDSAKLARSLRAGELKGIYVPGSESLETRSLIRLNEGPDAAEEPHQVPSAVSRDRDTGGVLWSGPLLEQALCRLAEGSGDGHRLRTADPRLPRQAVRGAERPEAGDVARGQGIVQDGAVREAP